MSTWLRWSKIGAILLTVIRAYVEWIFLSAEWRKIALLDKRTNYLRKTNKISQA